MPVLGRQGKNRTNGSLTGAIDPQLRKLQGIHEGFTRGLEAALSALLQKEVHARLGAIGLVSIGEIRKTFGNPDCIVILKLHPRADRMILHLGCTTALTLLEQLLGGSEGLPAAPRGLTEIEWSLLEELVGAILRPLAEAWHGIAEIEFAVESLLSDAEAVRLPEGTGPLVRIPLELECEGWTGTIMAAVPQSFFGGAALGPATPEINPQQTDRNLRLIGEAGVEMEVVLRGPTLPFEQLMALTPGQVVIFDFPLDQLVDASLNGVAWMGGHVVSSGRKRAFQVAQLPQLRP